MSGIVITLAVERKFGPGVQWTPTLPMTNDDIPIDGDPGKGELDPADIARVRIDFADWLKTLPRRTRRIAETLSIGETTSAVATRFHVSAARISQLRRQLKESWDEFVGEPDATATAAEAAA